MEAIVAAMFLVAFAMMLTWVVLNHLQAWNWIKNLVSLVVDWLLIVVNKIKEKTMECWDWSHWAVLAVWTWVWHNWLGEMWHNVWAWATQWWK